MPNDEEKNWGLGFYSAKGVPMVMNLKPMSEAEAYTMRSKQSSPSNCFAWKLTPALLARMQARYPLPVERDRGGAD